MVAWAAIFTDQDPIGRGQIEAIDKIMERSNEERGLSKLRDVVLGWHCTENGSLPLQEMMGRIKIAADDEGERQ